MMNLSLSESAISRELITGFAVALIAFLWFYILISVYHLGVLQGEQHAIEKRTLTVHHLGKHKAGTVSREADQTGRGDSGKLRTSPETETQEPA